MAFTWPDEITGIWNKNDLINAANRKSDELQIPRRVLLALLVAESGFNPTSARFAYRNDSGTYTVLTSSANSAIQNRDIDALRGILAEISNRGSTDISFGIGQQTVRWADEGDHTQSAENVLYIRHLYFDPLYAIGVAGRKVASYWNTYRDDIEALSRYNKPTIPSTSNPVAVANYKRGLTQADEMLANNSGGPVSTAFIDKRTSNIAGSFSKTPKGVILHGSRSGVAGRAKSVEAAGCANWCLTNPDELGWHASVGENEVYVHMKASEWGWNARSASDKYIGVEFAQATVNEAITDAQVDAFVAYMRTYILSTYPSIPMYFPTHADVEKSGETGKVDGKTDVFPYGSLEAATLKKRITDKLGIITPPTVPTFAFYFGFADIAARLGANIVGEPLMDETYIGDGYSYQFTTTGKMEYSKACNKSMFTLSDS